MSIVCSICITSILSETACSVKCGHVFHESCIRKWITQGEPSCPLCKQTATLSELRNTLYFSRTDGDNHDIIDNEAKTVDQLSAENTVLTAEIKKLTAENKTDKLIINRLKTSYEAIKSDYRSASNALRYIKLLKRVADLDDYMTSPATVAYLTRMKDSSQDELLTTLGALKGKFQNITNQRTEYEIKLNQCQKLVTNQKEKIKYLTQQLNNERRTRDTGIEKSIYESRYTKRPRIEHRSANVIVVDSDTDDEQPINHLSDEEEEFTIVEEIS